MFCMGHGLDVATCCNLFQHVGFTARVFLTFKCVFSSMFFVCLSAGDKEILSLYWCNHKRAARVGKLGKVGATGQKSHIDGLARPNVISSAPAQPHPNPIPTAPLIHQRNQN